MPQPNLPHQLVVPLLVEEQLVVAAQGRVRLAVAVEVGGVREAAAHGLVQEEHHALADVDEQSNIPAASAQD